MNKENLKIMGKFILALLIIAFMIFLKKIYNDDLSIPDVFTYKQINGVKRPISIALPYISFMLLLSSCTLSILHRKVSNAIFIPLRNLSYVFLTLFFLIGGVFLEEVGIGLKKTILENYKTVMRYDAEQDLEYETYTTTDKHFDVKDKFISFLRFCIHFGFPFVSFYILLKADSIKNPEVKRQYGY